jgi:hypothetical protein
LRPEKIGALTNASLASTAVSFPGSSPHYLEHPLSVLDTLELLAAGVAELDSGQEAAHWKLLMQIPRVADYRHPDC